MSQYNTNDTPVPHRIQVAGVHWSAALMSCTFHVFVGWHAAVGGPPDSPALCLAPPIFAQQRNSLSISSVSLQPQVVLQFLRVDSKELVHLGAQVQHRKVQCPIMRAKIGSRSSTWGPRCSIALEGGVATE
jgi:hypothetical protein